MLPTHHRIIPDPFIREAAKVSMVPPPIMKNWDYQWACWIPMVLATAWGSCIWEHRNRVASPTSRGILSLGVVWSPFQPWLRETVPPFQVSLEPVQGPRVEAQLAARRHPGDIRKIYLRIERAFNSPGSKGTRNRRALGANREGWNIDPRSLPNPRLVDPHRVRRGMTPFPWKVGQRSRARGTTLEVPTIMIKEGINKNMKRRDERITGGSKTREVNGIIIQTTAVIESMVQPQTFPCGVMILPRHLRRVALKRFAC